MSTRSFSFDFENPLAQEAVLVNASLSRYENDWPSIPHTHAFTELFYVLEGSGEFVIEDETFTISKDDLIIVNPHIQHTETSRNAAPLSYFTVGVDGISFSFHDQKEFQIFNCRKKKTDLQFYFHSLSQSWTRKIQAMRKSAAIPWLFSLCSCGGLPYPDSSWFPPFIQAGSAPRSSAIWTPATVRRLPWTPWQN